MIYTTVNASNKVKPSYYFLFKLERTRLKAQKFVRFEAFFSL